MPDSILNSIKKVLGIEAEATAFDPDIILHINTVFFTLQQIGVGPSEGFMITDADTEWSAYLGDNKNLNAVKTYMYLRVKTLFDPPGTSFVLDSMKKQMDELEWRLNVEVENGAFAQKVIEEPLVWEIDETEDFSAEGRIGDVGFDPETGNVWRVTS